MSRRTWLAWLLLVPTTFAIVFAPADAQEDKPAQRTEKKVAGPRGRLPNNWTRLDITNEQREAIYAVQAEYRPKIEDLQKQIEKLEMELDDKMRAVLTNEQREKLAKIESEAKEKAKTRRPRKSTSGDDGAKSE